MRRLLLLLLASLPFAACRDTPETGTRGSATASPYTADTDSRARDDTLEGTHTGTELEAPRLIPALKNQLELMSKGSDVNDDNFLAYKNLAQDVVNSMVADIHRAGYADTGSFRALKDSVLEDIGGGTSDHDLERSNLPRHIPRMQRLIEMYQEAMRKAADRL